MTPGDRMSKGLDFMLKGIEPKSKTPESESTSQESGEKSPEKSILIQESSIMTQDSGAQILEQEVVNRDSSILIQESGVMTHESSNSNQEESVEPGEARYRSRRVRKKSGVTTPESSVVSDEIIDMAVAQALQSPKISLYSPLLLAVLESQQLSLLNRKEITLLHYRKATKARELVEKALMESYPELCEKILERINEGNGKS